MQKKIKKWPLVLTLTVIYLLLFLFLVHYSLVKKETGLAGGTLISETFRDIIKRPFQIFPLPMKTVGLVLGITALSLLLVYDQVKRAAQRRHYDPNTVQGDAKWMVGNFLDEYNKVFTEPLDKTTHEGKNNMILSKDMYMSMDNRGIADHNNHNSRNMNVFAIGGSGAGKTFGLVGPNIMQANCSYVITDPSGELFANYSHFLERKGYRIKCFNIDHMDKGNHYNPFNYVHSDKDIAVLVSTLIANTTPPEKNSGDPFWEKSEVALLNALLTWLIMQ